MTDDTATTPEGAWDRESQEPPGGREDAAKALDPDGTGAEGQGFGTPSQGIAQREGRPSLRAFVALGVLVLLALVEAGAALTAPLRTPSDAEWQQAAAYVRQEKREGDLLVFAPAWVDPIGRLHMGDVLSMAEAGRMDEARYGRILEVSVRGGRAPEARAPAKLVATRHFGRVTVRVYEKPKAEVVYDFLERFKEARVMRLRHGTVEAECPLVGEKFQCAGLPETSMALRMLEPDYSPRRCLLVPPVEGAEVAVTFRAILGRTLAIRTGLHDYHQRKIADGKVLLRVLVDGVAVAETWHGSNDGWKPLDVDTSRHLGTTAEVTFVVASPNPRARQFCFAAEARR